MGVEEAIQYLLVFFGSSHEQRKTTLGQLAAENVLTVTDTTPDSVSTAELMQKFLWSNHTNASRNSQ